MSIAEQNQKEERLKSLHLGQTFPVIFERETKRLESIAPTFAGVQNVLYKQYVFLHTYVLSVYKASVRATRIIAQRLTADIRNNRDLQYALGVHRHYTITADEFNEFVSYSITYQQLSNLYNNYVHACQKLAFEPREKLNEEYAMKSEMPNLEDKFYAEILSAFTVHWDMLKNNIYAPLSAVPGDNAKRLLHSILEHCCVRLFSLEKSDLTNHLLIWNYYVTYM